MIASVHVADVGPRAALAMLGRPPKPTRTPGLRHANVASAAPLGRSVLPSPDLGRIAFVAFWDDDQAVDRFLADHPFAAKLQGGWHARLEPLRAHGAWPGLPPEVPATRKTEYEGPALVLTLGRLRLSQAVRFLRTSAKAEGAVVGSPGLVWATGLARPPFVSTCSLWESTQALSTYAYGDRHAPHPDAIAVDQAKPFHKMSAFIRFRPYGTRGHLEGRNPLSDGAFLTS
jgi:hypothetical protein